MPRGNLETKAGFFRSTGAIRRAAFSDATSRFTSRRSTYRVQKRLIVLNIPPSPCGLCLKKARYRLPWVAYTRLQVTGAQVVETITGSVLTLPNSQCQPGITDGGALGSWGPEDGVTTEGGVGQGASARV
jgi:hypothetical protein